MHLERLKKFRDFLADIPAESFDHGSWHKKVDGLNSKVQVGGKNVCGTTACIAGWCAISENLLDWGLDDKNRVVFYANAYNSGNVAAEWLDLNDAEQAIMFYPFELETQLLPDDFDWDVYDDLMSKQYLFDDTTVSEAVKFLDRVIEEERVDIEFWKDAKQERLSN